MEKGPHFLHIKVLWLYSVDIVDIIENWASMKSLIDSKFPKDTKFNVIEDDTPSSRYIIVIEVSTRCQKNSLDCMLCLFTWLNEDVLAADSPRWQCWYNVMMLQHSTHYCSFCVRHAINVFISLLYFTVDGKWKMS